MNNPYNTTPATVLRNAENEVARLDAMAANPKNASKKLNAALADAKSNLSRAHAAHAAWVATWKK